MTAKRPLILIADDAPDDIADYKRHLTRDQSRRYKIIKATTGAKALAICERRRPDCMLLDFRLPDLNGLEVLQALADKSGVLPFAVVVLAEVGDTHIVVEAMKYGAHDFLEKSWITPEMLERAVANAIEKAALQREVVEQRRELATKNLMLEQQLADLRREINERRQVEEALTAIERRFKRLIEAQPSIVWMSDAMGSVTYINDYWTELTGLTFEQSLDAGWLAAVHPDDAARLEAEWNQAVAVGASHESRHRYLRPDGEYRWHLCRSVPLRDENGAIQEWVGVSVDIHDRLRAEEALRLANDRFTVAEAAANGYVYDRDPVTNRVERSAGFGAVLGYDESETAGTHNWWRTLIHPDDLHRVKAMLDQASSGLGMDEMDGYSIEYRIRHKDGRYLWVWDRGRVMRDKTRRVRRVIGSVVDISGRKQIENSLRENESRLKLAITAMNGGAWEWDLITDEVRWSDEMYEFFDRRPGDFKPTVEGWLRTLSAEDRARAADVIKAVRNGEDAQMVYCATGSDGAARWLELRGITLHDDRGRPILLVGITIDITERKLAEEALRESEALAHTLAANLSDGLIYQMRRGPDGSRRFLYISENVERLRGVTAEEAMADANKVYNLVPEDYRQRLIEAEDAALRDFTDFRFETPFLTRSGDLRWSQQSSSPRRLSDGSVVWDGVEIDITDRKRAEETLRESEEKFSKVFKASPHRIAITTLDEGRYIDVNDAVLRTTGYERSEMIGRTGEELQMFAWPGGREEFFQALQNGAVRDLEVPLRSKSGEIRTVLMSADIITLNGQKCILAVSNDITERKRTEEALRESEEKFSKAFKASPHRISIWTMDEGRCLDANDTTPSSLGYERSEMIGRTAVELGVFAEPDTPKKLLKAVRNGPVRNVELQLRSKSGEIRTVLWSADIITLNGEQCLLNISNDITDRKRAEEALRESEEKFSKVFKASPHRITISTLDEGRYIDVNDAVLSGTGYKRSEMIGRTAKEIKIFAGEGRKRLSQALENGSVRDLEVGLRSKNGEVRTVLMSAEIITLNGFQCVVTLSNDITERKRTEEARRESEERLKLAMDAASMFVWETDLATGRVTWSDSGEQMMGMKPGSFGGTYDAFLSIVHPDDRESVISARNRALEDEAPYEVECRKMRPDGGVQWALSRGIVYRNEDGQPARLVGVSMDITERKQAEEELREKERFIQSLIDAVPAGIYIYDLKESRNLFTNPRLASMLGYTTDELTAIGSNFLGFLLHPEDWRRAQAHFETLREAPDGSALEIEYRMKHRDGQWRWVISREMVFRRGADGRPSQILGVWQEITERKLAEEELQRANRRYQITLDALDGYIYEYNVGDNASERSKGLAKLIGVEPEEAPPRLEWWIDHIHPDDRDRFRSEVGKTLAEDSAAHGETPYSMEYRMLHKEGHYVDVLDRFLVVRDADGRPVHVVGAVINITERKRVEETLRENEERLRMTLEAANAGSFDWDIAAGIIVWTPGRHASSQIHDIEQDYQSWRATVHPEDIDWVEADIAKSLAEQRDLYVEYRVLRPDGSVRWVSNIGHAFYNETGEPTRMKGLRIDLTDRKRAEELLRESEERLRLALEGAKAGVWEVRFDPYSAHWSKEYRDLFGFSETDEATNELWATRIQPDDLQRVVDGNNALLNSERNEMRQEFRIIHPKHGERWILDFVRVRRDQSGRPISFGGINLDVTDRRRAEEALRESEERFRELVETISDVFWIMSPESQAPTYLSPACERLWGRPAKELNGNLDRWFDAIHHEDRERVRKKYLARAGEGGYDETYRVVRPDGSMVWVHDRGFPVCDEAGAIRHIVGVAEDVTERKRFEDEVRESQRRYAALAEAVPQLVWTAAADGAVDYFNQRWYAYTGTTPDESLNQAWRSLIHPDDRERVEKLWKRSVRLGEHLHFEFRLRRADSGYRWFIGRAVPYREERRGATPRKQDGENGAANGENGAANAGNGAALNGGKGRIVKWFGTFTDIHDLKIAEEALRESEEHARRQNAELENIYQATPVGLSLLDRDFRFVRVNETMARIDGASVSGALGRTAREVTPKIADRLEPVFKRVMRTGRPIMNLEIRVETPREPGVDRDWLASYYPVKAADGSVQGIGCVVLDITERKRAEEALRESEERLRQAAQAAGFGLYSVNLQTGENYLSPELGRIFGLSDDDVKLDGSLGLIHPDDRERTMRVIEAALDPRGDGEFEHEFRAQLPDGNTRWALAKGKTLFVGNGRRRKAARIIGVAFDITKRREDEERLHASERRLKLSLAAGHAGTWEWRIKEDKLIWSDEYYELYGMAPGDMEPTLDNFILCVHPEDRDRILAEMSEVLQERKDAELEFRFIQAGGESRWAHSSAQLTLDESGEPEMLVGIIIDITERKQAEMEREELFRKEREAREQAEAANRGKDEFVAMVSHELRSPLNAMLGWSKILKKGGVDAKTQSHAVEVIERSARAQQTLIEDLLDMARIVGGKLRLETRPVSLSRVVEAAADVVRPAAVAREINLRPFYNSADEVTGDPDRLQQVVWNLLSNAVKFTPRGGSVEVVLERVGASAQITVTDTGRGIKAEDLPFIFDRFRQADSSSSRRFTGLGLGLALVKHLVELHGGQVSADSPGEGGGASFIVRLPVRAVRGEATPARGMDRASLRIEERDGRVTEREARSDFPAFPLDGVWALIVDDEADARELIATLLKQYGARVTVASCAADAFDKLRNGEAGARPDVLISDISMPDEDGYMLIERVRKLPSEEGGKIPAIALTALERPNDRIKALASGFSMHVPKPVEPEELAMVIANLTGHPAAIIL